MRQIGVGYTREYVQRFGLPAEHIPADLTAALGTAQLTPLEMADGFAVFANGGSLVKPHVIDRILSADGSVLEETDAPVACADCAASAAPARRRPARRGPGRRAARRRARVRRRRQPAGAGPRGDRAARDLGGERLDHHGHAART